MEYLAEVKGLNKELATELRKYNSNITGASNKLVDACVNMYNIVSQEMFTSDFESMSDFAKYIGKTKQDVSKMVKCGHIANWLEDTHRYTVGQLQEVCRVFENDEDYIEAENIIVNVLGVEDTDTLAIIRNKVNLYKQGLEVEEAEVEEAEVEEAEVEEAEVEEAEVEEAEEFKEVVDNDGIKYFIPMSILVKYIVD